MKRLVLLGGGHAHVQVISSLAASPLSGWHVDLVTPYPRQVYSGMLSGWIAGHYPIDACTLPVAELAHRAQIELHLTSVSRLDLDRNEVHCANGATIPFDLLSINTGPEPASAVLSGAAEHALALRPIETFVAAWPSVLDRLLRATAGFDMVIVGAGAAGVELAFAIRHRIGDSLRAPVRISLVDDDESPLPGAPHRVRQRVADLLHRRGIQWFGGRRAVGIRPTAVEFANTPAIACDACILATGASAPAWPAAAGLATDSHGFIRVDATLRSVSHPSIFAAGNVAAYHADRPKSGVFAVRAGPVLTANLQAAAAGHALRAWEPQRHALYIIGTGGEHALAWRGPWSIAGRWVWHWKDRIDRRFIGRFSR